MSINNSFLGKVGAGMLFDKEVRKICSFCLHASDFSDSMVLCEKYGPVSLDHACRRFIYDPLRRTPPPPPRLKLPPGEEAFKLD